MVAVVAPVDAERRRFPVAGIAAEEFVTNRLERGVRRRRGLRAVSIPDRGQQGLGPGTGLVCTDGTGLTDDFPDPPAARFWLWTKYRLAPEGNTLTPKPFRLRSRTS